MTIPAGTTYVLNTKSKKFHIPKCGSVGKISAKNMKFSTDTVTNIVAAGYVPCKSCEPYVGNKAKSSTTNIVKKAMLLTEVNSASVDETSTAPVPLGSTYVLNTNTKKFHNPGCSSVGDMAAQNRKDVNSSREEIIGQGYVPCKKCNP